MIQENFINTIQQSICKNWDRPAYTDYGTTHTMTYGDVAAQIARIHIILQAAGVKRADRVSLIGRNNSSWTTTYLAVITYGAIIVPILQDFHPSDTLHIINDSGSKMLFCSDMQYENLDIHEMSNVVAIISLDDFRPLIAGKGLDMHLLLPECITATYQSLYPNGYKPEDIHYCMRENVITGSINYTSGTTGFSKGVLTPLNALAGNVKFCLQEGVIRPDSRQLVFLPLAHAFGCAFDFLSTFCAGAHAWLVGKTPSPRILLEAFQVVKPTCIFTVPLILEKLYKKFILPMVGTRTADELREFMLQALGGCVEQVIVGGAPLNDAVCRFFSEIRFPFTVGYGMTECAPLITFSPAKDYKPGSCGRVLNGYMEMRILNPNAEGVGEVVVRGEHLMSGYYHVPNSDTHVFTDDGWLKTGDLGYIDQDGFLFLKGRCKTMLLGPNGQNIYPEAIEAKLNNLMFVLESLVLSGDDGLVALVYPDYKLADNQRIGHEELLSVMEQNRRLLNLKLARYEQIQKITLYPHEFEKTPKKNIKRFLYTQVQ